MVEFGFTPVQKEPLSDSGKRAATRATDPLPRTLAAGIETLD